jgi:hypothetical protein
MGEPRHEATTTRDEEATGAAAMFANDRASQHLGITVDDHGPGWARCSMTVTEIMTNGHDITHGGYVFLFADTTFAMACNYPGRSRSPRAGTSTSSSRPSSVTNSSPRSGGRQAGPLGHLRRHGHSRRRDHRRLPRPLPHPARPQTLTVDDETPQSGPGSAASRSAIEKNFARRR